MSIDFDTLRDYAVPCVFEALTDLDARIKALEPVPFVTDTDEEIPE